MQKRQRKPIYCGELKLGALKRPGWARTEADVADGAVERTQQRVQRRRQRR